MNMHKLWNKKYDSLHRYQPLVLYVVTYDKEFPHSELVLNLSSRTVNRGAFIKVFNWASDMSINNIAIEYSVKSENQINNK